MEENFTSTVPSDLFVANALSCKGIPYKWGGKDVHGLDCSGLVTQAYYMSGGEDIRGFWNAAKLKTECQLVEPVDYKQGLLAFYGFSDKTPNHVVIIMNEPGTSGLTAYGACGGNHYCLTPEDAKKMGAKVQFRPRIQYRHDFQGVYSWERIDYSK